MIVTRIEADGYTPFSNFAVDLPPKGLVLILGANGNGKTSTIETVPFAMWGETLRGVNPWRRAGRLLVRADGLDVEVQHKGRTDTVLIDGQTFLRKQATVELSRRFGLFDTWRRAYLVGANAILFAGATDGGRKRFLEQVLGLGAFDHAASAARAEHRQISTKAQHAKLTLQHAKAEVARLSVEGPAPRRPTPPPASDAPTAALAWSEALWNDICADREEAGRRLAVADGELERAQDDHDAVAGGRCDRCHQPVVGAALDELVGCVEVAQEIRDGLARHLDRLKLAAIELGAELAWLEERARARDAQERVYERLLATFEAEERARAQVDQQRARAAEALKAAETEAADALEAEQRIQVIERAFGLHGIRTQLLGTAVSALSSAVRPYFRRVVADGEIDLRLVDTDIEIEIKVPELVKGTPRFGGAAGYRACSGGERRRIDSAFVLGTADIAGAYAGHPDGDLWLDEAFDALDDEGVETVAELLAEVARRRKVVVVTHNTALGRTLWSRAAVRVQYEAGGRIQVS